MKRVLILGGTGMLGHRLYLELRNKYQVMITIRGSFKSLDKYKVFQKEEVREDVDALNFDSIIRALASFKPHVVLNCIGLIKQLPISTDPIYAINVNSLLPHRISLICASSGIRFIHISTDCVFSGKTGNYVEEDISDADDLYGRSKYLGEVNYKPHSLTIRTSIIGLELKVKLGLVEWFLRQEGQVKGFTKVIYSGLTTNEFAKIVSDFIIPNDKLSGLYHVSTEPISKYELLSIVKKVFKKEIEIIPDESIVLDRSLNSNRFRVATSYLPPSWQMLIEELQSTHIKY